MKQEALLADQVRTLYNHTGFGSTATLINGCILVFVLPDQVPVLNLRLWLGGVVILTIGRVMLYRQYLQAASSRVESARWKGYFNASVFLSGILWGAVALFLFPSGSIGHQAFIAFVAGGMVAGALGSYTALLSTFYLFCLPALLPIIIRFFLMGSTIHIAMGTMGLLFLTIMCLMAMRIHKDYINLLSLKFENSGLVKELRQEIVQRRQAEKDLVRQNQRIEAIVATRTAELNTAVERLREEVKTRKEIAQDLKDNQQRMQAIIDYAPLVIWAIDQDGIFTFSEGKGLEKIGIKPGGAVGKSLFHLFEDNEQIIQNARRVLSGEFVAGATTYQGIVYENRLEPIWDDNLAVIGAIGVAIDITAQKKAQEALRRGEEKYRELIENINDVLLTMDHAGRITYVSPVIESVLGYRPEEVCGKSAQEFIDPKDRERMSTTFSKAIERQNIVSEYRILDKSGEVKWCRTSVRPVLEDNRVVGLQGMLADITQSKSLEEQLQRAQKMEALGTLAGGVAHDLNNILSGIVSYPDLLLLDLPENNPMRESLSIIKASGERAAAIVQDLLTLARRGVSAAELLNLNHIIEEYLNSPEFNVLISSYPQVRIRKQLRADLFNMTGSRVHLSKTVMNLISNAVEAMPKGGTITLGTFNKYMDRQQLAMFDAVKEGEYVALTVADTGIGIDHAHLTRIFEPFYSKKVMGRSGSRLGMAVVWGTVKDHGGYINVKSEKDVGSCFELLFPATRKPLPASDRPVPPEDYLGRGELILVVDDVAQQREIAAMMLNRLGYRAETVASGEAAIDYLTLRKPDLILLDMIMSPGIDGLETYEQILKINPHQKAVIVSGYSDTRRVRKAQALGAGKYVKKPYTIETIGMAIRKELEN